MRAVPLILAGLFIVSLLPAARGAGDQTAPALAPTTNTLYVHRSTADADELSGWMNTLESDANGDDTAMGPAAGCNNNPTGAAGVPLSGNEMVDDTLWGDPIDRTYTITLDPALGSSVGLDKSKPAKATIAFGAGSCGGHPHIESTLSSDGKAIATGAGDHKYTPGAPYPTIAIDMPVTADALAKAPLIWTIHLTGTYYGAGFLGVGDPQGHTSLQLPITTAAAPNGGGSGAPRQVYQTLTGPTADLRITMDTAADQFNLYNWTSNLTDAVVTYTISVDNGTVQLLIADGADKTFMDQKFDASTTNHKEFTTKAGPWHIGVAMFGFKGKVTVTIAAPAATPAGGPAPTSKAGGAPEAVAPAKGDAGASSSSSKGSPSPSLLPVLAAMAAALLLLRRR